MRRGIIFLILISGRDCGTIEARQAGTDVTQWRGANRDGAISGFTAPASWPAQLTQRWKVDVGFGYATPIVVGNRVYVFSRQGEDEVMSALDAASGKVLWRTAYPAPFEMNSAAKPHGPGPKSTPVFFERPSVFHRHDWRRHRLRRGKRQTALAEAGVDARCRCIRVMRSRR